MRKITTGLLIFLLLSISNLQAKDFHKWTDKDGSVHYTTNPGAIPEGKRKESETIKGSKYSPNYNDEPVNSNQNKQDTKSENSTPEFKLYSVESSFIRRIGYDKSSKTLFVEIENLKNLSKEYKELKVILRRISGKNRLALSTQDISRYEFRISNLIKKINRKHEQIKLLELLKEYTYGENSLFLTQQESSRNQLRINNLKRKISLNNSSESSTKISQYIYLDVEKNVFDNFLLADSKGEFFNINIKGYYRYNKIE